MSRCDVADRSACRASSSVRDGNSVSPSAAIEPLVPTISNATHPARTPAAAGPAARIDNLLPPESHQAVSAMHARRMNVFSRCTAMNSARAMLALSATSWNNTRPAPTAASLSMKNSDNTPPVRAGCPGPHTRQIQITNTTTDINAKPLVSR